MAQLWQAWPFCCRAGILWIQLLSWCEGLWCLLKGALCLIAPEHCIMAVLPLFSLNADWLAPQFTGSAQLKSARNPRFFYVEPFLLLWIMVSVFFSCGGCGTAHFWLCLSRTTGWSSDWWWCRLYKLKWVIFVRIWELDDGDDAGCLATRCHEITVCCGGRSFQSHSRSSPDEHEIGISSLIYLSARLHGKCTSRKRSSNCFTQTALTRSFVWDWTFWAISTHFSPNLFTLLLRHLSFASFFSPLSLNSTV